MILQDLEDICIDLMESELPGIIDGLVEENLNPTETCVSIGACSHYSTDGPETTAAPSTTAAPETTMASRKFMKLI